MLGQAIRWETMPRDPTPSIDRLSQRFEVVARDLAKLARRIQAEGRWDETFVDTWQGRTADNGDVTRRTTQARPFCPALPVTTPTTNLPKPNAQPRKQDAKEDAAANVDGEADGSKELAV